MSMGRPRSTPTEESRMRPGTPPNRMLFNDSDFGEIGDPVPIPELPNLPNEAVRRQVREYSPLPELLIEYESPRPLNHHDDHDESEEYYAVLEKNVAQFARELANVHKDDVEDFMKEYYDFHYTVDEELLFRERAKAALEVKREDSATPATQSKQGIGEESSIETKCTASTSNYVINKYQGKQCTVTKIAESDEKGTHDRGTEIKSRPSGENDNQMAKKKKILRSLDDTMQTKQNNDNKIEPNVQNAKPKRHLDMKKARGKNSKRF